MNSPKSSLLNRNFKEKWYELAMPNLWPVASRFLMKASLAGCSGMRDLPRSSGGFGEVQTGFVLTVGAAAMVLLEGADNIQSVAWAAMALILAIPPMLRLTSEDVGLPRRRDWVGLVVIASVALAAYGYRTVFVDDRGWDAACRIASAPIACVPREAILVLQYWQALGAMALARLSGIEIGGLDEASAATSAHFLVGKAAAAKWTRRTSIERTSTCVGGRNSN